MSDNLSNSKAIQKLKSQTDLLKKQLRSKSSQRTGLELNLARLQEEAYLFTTRISEEKKVIQKLNSKISYMNQKISNQNLSTKQNNLNKTVKSFEHKLENTIQNHQSQLTQNKALRKRIDQLRREKIILKNNLLETQKEIQNKKQQIEKDLQKLDTLDGTHKALAQEVKDLKNFLSQQQAENPNLISEFSLKLPEEPKYESSLDLSEPKTPKIELKTPKKGSLKNLIQKIENYQESLAKLQSVSGTSDLNQLLDSLSEKEVQNYGMVNYINYLNQNLQEIENKSAGISVKLKEFTPEVPHEPLNTSVSNLETKYTSNKQLIAEISQKLKIIFEEFPLENSFRPKTPKTSKDTLEIYLKHLEDLTNLLIENYYLKSGEEFRVPLKKRSSKIIKPPSITEETKP